eukprot:CAMPEP_0205939614 /NCGR_PEP_ID=MMETSP1325-20131115/50128_1 /ASSEMBLY_ACC=CAM_ASM_000708 /TAXON_ID=236786 /ORGANISM="Florenciella sp., Strain RCC1007" /LENGTH=135 /DNA_ID=CAMNT_0053310095 /DNA_START=8 /DNA_END=414 /DNA_ORIENTATION=-
MSTLRRMNGEFFSWVSCLIMLSKFVPDGPAMEYCDTCMSHRGFTKTPSPICSAFTVLKSRRRNRELLWHRLFWPHQPLRYTSSFTFARDTVGDAYMEARMFATLAVIASVVAGTRADDSIERVEGTSVERRDRGP